jgi:hypothetical protein
VTLDEDCDIRSRESGDRDNTRPTDLTRPWARAPSPEISARNASLSEDGTSPSQCPMTAGTRVADRPTPPATRTGSHLSWRRSPRPTRCAATPRAPSHRRPLRPETRPRSTPRRLGPPRPRRPVLHLHRSRFLLELDQRQNSPIFASAERQARRQVPVGHPTPADEPDRPVRCSATASRRSCDAASAGRRRPIPAGVPAGPVGRRCIDADRGRGPRARRRSSGWSS